MLPPRHFNKYVDICNDLFKTNSLYISTSVRWYAVPVEQGADYTFDYDSLPKVIFAKNINLVCSSKGDSSTIYKTHGVYYPTTELFYGDGGTVNWVRAGWDANVVNAKFARYAIDISR